MLAEPWPAGAGRAGAASVWRSVVSGPVVFVSDLGLRDEFVGVCHLVIARIAPEALVVDLSHGVPPHDIQAGAMMLAHGITHGGPYAVGLGIVDPGVGTGRRAIAVATADGPRLVGPDNGLLSLAWKSLGGVIAAVEIDPRRSGPRTCPRCSTAGTCSRRPPPISRRGRRWTAWASHSTRGSWRP